MEPMLITYHRGCVRDADGAWISDLPVVRVAFNRPEVRNAFRPLHGRL